MSLYVIHMDHPTGLCGLILADHSIFSPRCVPSQLSSLITGLCGNPGRSFYIQRCVPSQLSSLCHYMSYTWIILLDSVA